MEADTYVPQSMRRQQEQHPQIDYSAGFSTGLFTFHCAASISVGGGLIGGDPIGGGLPGLGTHCPCGDCGVAMLGVLYPKYCALCSVICDCRYAFVNTYGY